MKYFAKPLASIAIAWMIIIGGVTSLASVTSISTVYAQQGASISGDDACGSYTKTVDANGREQVNIAKCDFVKFKAIAKAFLYTLIIPIGAVLLVVFIIYRVLMAQKALMEGNTNAYKEASKKIANAIFSFIVVIAVLGGALLAILKFLGVNDAYTIFLSYGQVNSFGSTVVSAFVETTYAQAPQCSAGGGGCIANPVGATNLYDFILVVVRLFIRWFVFPAIIAMWVWTGFAFVAAQGKPDALAKAKKWLLWSIIATIVIAMTEGFLFAIRGTVNAILPGASASIDVIKDILAIN